MAEPDRDDLAEDAPLSYFHDVMGGWRGALEGVRSGDRLPWSSGSSRAECCSCTVSPCCRSSGRSPCGATTVASRHSRRGAGSSAWPSRSWSSRATGKGEVFSSPASSARNAQASSSPSRSGERAGLSATPRVIGRKYEQWREYEPLRRACTIATAVWALTFTCGPALCERWIYRQPGDADGKLLIVDRCAIKWRSSPAPR